MNVDSERFGNVVDSPDILGDDHVQLCGITDQVFAGIVGIEFDDDQAVLYEGIEAGAHRRFGESAAPVKFFERSPGSTGFQYPNEQFCALGGIRPGEMFAPPCMKLFECVHKHRAIKP